MKLDRRTALALCDRFELPRDVGALRPDFHALTRDQVSRLVECADVLNYRQPKNANASRGCYFYGHLGRALARQDR